jgi:hypothetical protein
MFSLLFSSGTQDNPGFGIFKLEEGCSFIHLPDENIWKDLSEYNSQAVMRTLNKETNSSKEKTLRFFPFKQ